METFLPSEIARLVLGYLKEENCQETSKAFMRECSHLQEYLAMLHQGREFSTEVLGLSLKMILDEYGNMKLSRRMQTSPGLTNLWDRYELMGSQLRQAITPDVNARTQSVASQSLVNNMQTFSRRQGSRNRYRSARTEGVVVVRSEVAITTASAPPNTPRRGTNSNVGGTFSLPTGSVPGCILEGGGSSSCYSGRRSKPPSQREDDLESLVSVCSVMSSICGQVDCVVMVDHTAMNVPGKKRLDRALTVVDPVPHQESTTPAKIISPTSQSPLSSTQLTYSTPGNFPKTSQQSTGSSATTDRAGAQQSNPKKPRCIQSKMIGDGAVLSPIRALTATSKTLCDDATSMTSHTPTTSCGYHTVSSSILTPATTCYSGTNMFPQSDIVMMRSRTLVKPGSLNPSCTSGVVSNVLTPLMSINDKTTPFYLFPIDPVSDTMSCDVTSFVPSTSVPVGSNYSVPTTSLDSVPVYAVPFDSCNPGSTGFGFDPVICDMVPVTSCDSVPVTSNQSSVTVASVPVMPCALDQAQSREMVTPCVTDTLGTPSKRRSCSNRIGNGDGNAIDYQVPRTPLRLRRHLSKELSSPRDRRKKAQPCKHKPAAEQVSASGATSANTLSALQCNGGASLIESNPAKSVLSDLDISEMLERLIGNQAIAEKIAENINRLTSQNTSRSDSAANADDPGPSNRFGTAPDTLSKSLNHNPDSTAEGTSISMPFESIHQRQEGIIPTLNGDNNGLANGISGVGNNVVSVVDADAGSRLERSAVQQDCQLERLNLHQSGQTYEETASDMSCTSLLSLSNLDQMTDDAIRFVFDQLCNDPNLDSICSMTYHHTERMDVDVIDSSATSIQSSSVRRSHMELGNCAPFTDSMSKREIPSSSGGDLQLPVPNVVDHPITASMGFDTRRQYIQVCFPGAGGHPDRIDIVEVIGSGVEISNGQPSPGVRSTTADGCQELPLVDSGRETASENPMLLSSQDMSNCLHSSTGVASTLADESMSGWSIPDPLACESTLTKSTEEYFSRFVVAPTECPRNASESDVAQSIDSGLNASSQLSTIAESDLVRLGTSVLPSSDEVNQFSNNLPDLEPSPVKVISNTSSAVLSGLCCKRKKPANDFSPTELDNSKKKKRHRPCNSMKTPAVELKLEERTGNYDRIEKRRQLGLGVPGKITAIASSQIASSTGCLASGSFPVLNTPDFIMISEVPSRNMEGSPNLGRKEARGRNLSKKKFRFLNRGRGPSTSSSVSTGSFTASGVSAQSTPSGGVIDPLISIENASGVPSPSESAVGGSFKGTTGPPTVSGSAVGSAGCAKDPFASDAITGQPSNSGSVVGLSGSSRMPGLCDPTESAKVPSTPMDSVSDPSNSIRSIIVPSSMPPDNTNSATDERKVSGHKSRRAGEIKSMVVYFKHDDLSPRMKNQECSNRSLVSAVIPTNNISGVFSNIAFSNEKLHKASKKSKKKSKHSSGSDKNMKGHTDKKGRMHGVRDSIGKRADGSFKTEEGSGASHDKKNIQWIKKDREKERKELLSNPVQYVCSSDDDDLPIAHFLRSGTYKDLSNKGSKGNTGLSTLVHCPISTPPEAVRAKKRLKKEKKKSDCCTIASNNSLSTQKSKGLGVKTKAANEKKSIECSAITISDDSLSIIPNCSLQSSAPDVSSRTVQSVNNIESEIVSSNTSTLCSQENILSNAAQSTKTNWNNIKIHKFRHSLPGTISTWRTNTNSRKSVLPSAAVVPGRSKSLENVLADCGATKTPDTAHYRSQLTPLASAPKSRTSTLPGSSKLLENLLPNLKTSKTVDGIDTKPQTTFPTKTCRPLKNILSDRGTSIAAVETFGNAPTKSQVASSQKTPIASVPKPRTASPSKNSSIPPQRNFEFIACNGKAPTNYESNKSQKHSLSGQLVSLSLAESLSVCKHPQPKPSKTKKNEQVIVSKQPTPSLLSRATKVSKPSSYKMSCNTLLSMPSSLEQLAAMANKGMRCNDYKIQTDMEAEHLETNVLPLRHSDTNLPVACIPMESTVNGRYDDVDIASALLSLSSSVPGDSGFANIPYGSASTETASACAESSEHSTELVYNSEIETEMRCNPSLRYKSLHDSGKVDLTTSDPMILSPQVPKDSPGQSQAETTCSYDSGTVDFTSAARDLNIDGCCTKHLRTSSFSSPSIGLVLNIDEGSARTPSSSSSSTYACPSVPESHADEYPASWPSEEISKQSCKRRRSSSADSGEKAKRMLRKRLKGLDITAFLKQLHPPKNSD